jgi:thiol-disulfide isomerase/thioredoxin
MLKSSCITFILIGLLALGLAACNGAEASQPAPVEAEAPAKAAQPVAVEQPPVEAAAPESSMAEKPAETVEEVEPVAEESMVKAGEPAAAEEAMAAESMAKAGETMTEAPMAKVEETAPEVEEAAAMAEAAPLEEEAMKQEIMTETGPTEAQKQLLAGLPSQGMPPELFNEVWLNSDPLKLADLHGKVVIVEFWTFGCINCKNVVPSLREWHQKYSDDGLVIIGIHTPEFGYESEIENVKQALIDQDIPYAVAIDNDWQTWRSYNNRYWPAKYFIDKAGNLRHIHIGEGRYEQQEEMIQALLAENLS